MFGDLHFQARHVHDYAESLKVRHLHSLRRLDSRGNYSTLSLAISLFFGICLN